MPTLQDAHCRSWTTRAWECWVALRLTQPTVALICAMLLCATAALAQKPADKPRVPPGVDPGGVAVAIIGNGVDYTRPEIAKRLARDGEGEIIGWDFVDNDRRPYSTCPQSPLALGDCTTNHVHALMLSLYRRSLGPRLIIVRASTSEPQTLVQAMQLISRLPTRIVLFAGREPPIPREFLHEAAKRFPQLLLIGNSSGSMPQGLGPEVAGNLRIVDAGHLHAAEAAGLLADKPELDASALNATLFGGSSVPPILRLETVPRATLPSPKP